MSVAERAGGVQSGNGGLNFSDSASGAMIWLFAVPPCRGHMIGRSGSTKRGDVGNRMRWSIK